MNGFNYFFSISFSNKSFFRLVSDTSSFIIFIEDSNHSLNHAGGSSFLFRLLLLQGTSEDLFFSFSVLCSSNTAATEQKIFYFVTIYSDEHVNFRRYVIIVLSM